MYHFRDVTLSFTKRKWQTYECPKDSLPKQGGLGWVSPSLSREGWGGSPVVVGLLLTLHLNALSLNDLRRTVKFFYLMQHLYNTTSTHIEMYHHSLLGTFIAQIIWPFGNMFVLLPSETHKTRKYGTTAWTKQSTAESLSGASKYERGVLCFASAPP